MPITATNHFKGRRYPGEVILTAVRWYPRYPLSSEHVSESLRERGFPAVSGMRSENQRFANKGLRVFDESEPPLMVQGQGATEPSGSYRLDLTIPVGDVDPKWFLWSRFRAFGAS